MNNIGKMPITQEKSIEINEYLKQYFNDYLIVSNVNDNQLFAMSDGDPIVIGTNLGVMIVEEAQIVNNEKSNIIVHIALETLRTQFKGTTNE